MMLSEMSDQQRTRIELFETILSDAGWDLEPFTSQLHSGTWLSPEGSADFENPKASLSLDFYLDTNYFLLIIESDDRRLEFCITATIEINPLLNWLVSCQDDLNPNTFTEHLKNLIPVCDKVLYLSANGKKYELDLENAKSLNTSQ